MTAPAPATSRDEYLRSRYGGRLQRWVNRREQQHVRYLCRSLGNVDSILDLPCGHGRFTTLLRARAKVRLVCADLDETRLAALMNAEESHGAAGQRRARLETMRVDLAAPLPFADEEFDVVFAFRFFHHVSDAAARARILRELARVARRHLLISYYGVAPIHGLEKYLWRAATGRRSRLAMISRGEMHLLLRECGFRASSDRAMFPLIHAQRVSLFARVP